MKRMRIFTFALALALLVSLAGCGGASQTDKPAETPAQASAVPSPVPAETPAPPEKPAPSEKPAPEDETIRVGTAGEFLKAIAPGAVIELAPGAYNLTEYLNGASDVISDWVERRSAADGWQAEIYGVEGLTIRGAKSGKVEVVAEPRYADVLYFNACSGITIENVTFGHTIEQGNCSGSVLRFDRCRNVALGGLDLYGCGTYGVAADHTVGIALKDCIIRDCSYGIIDMLLCSDVTCEDCTFKDNGGFDMLSLYESFALFDGCAFTGNEGSDFLPLFASQGGDSGARFERCTFDRWESERLNEELKGRGNFVIGKDCRFKAAADKRIVHVSDMEELIESIAPDTQILLAPGRYCLSDALSELFAREGGRFNESREYVRIDEVYDGLELVVTGVNGLTIASESGSAADTEIVTDPRYADVLSFENCSGTGIMNLTMGHTEVGECAGDVLHFIRCSDTVLCGLDLYGCGVYGIRTDGCGLLTCFDSTIRDCEYGTLELYAAKARQMFVNCVMTGSGGGGFFSLDDEFGGQFSFFRCTFGEGESSTFAAFAFNDVIVAEDCSWSEVTEYPEYYEGEEGDYERVALDTARLKVVSFDTKVLTDEYYYICYEAVNRRSGDVTFETGSDLRFLVFEEDGTGCLWENDETGRPFKYAMDSAYSCALSFDDGGEAAFSLYADQGGALPDGEEGAIWLALYLDEEVLWFY